jgi:hypothetical protein
LFVSTLGALGKFNVRPNVGLFIIRIGFSSHVIGFYSETRNMDWSGTVNYSLLDPLPFLVGRFLSRNVGRTVSLLGFFLQSWLKSKPWRKEMYST